MCDWDKIHSTFGPNQILKLYTNYTLPFPVEVRNYLKYWINGKFSNVNVKLDPDDLAHHASIQSVVSELYHEIEGAARRLQESVQDTVAVYRLIQKCLEAEFKLFQEEAARTLPTVLGPVHEDQTQHRFAHINYTLQNTNKRASDLLQQFSEFVNSQAGGCNYVGMNGVIGAGSQQALQIDKNLESNLCGLESEFTREMSKIYNDMIEIKNNVFQELEKWKRAPTTSVTLLNTQELYSGLFDVVSKCQTQLGQLMNMQTWNSRYLETQELSNLKLQFYNLFNELIQKSLVIEVHPSQVLKKEKNYCATIRFLAGSSSHLRINFASASVLSRNEMTQLTTYCTGDSRIQYASSHCVVFPKKQTKPQAPTPRNKFRDSVKKFVSSSKTVKLVKSSQNYETDSEKKYDWKITIYPPCDLANHVAHFDVDAHKGSAQFPKLKVKRIGPRGKENGKGVLHYEYWILFHAEVSYITNGCEIKSWVFTLSNSIRILTSDIQEAEAWQSVMWSNALNAKVLFSGNLDKQSLLWPQLGSALNYMFVEMTGVELNNQQLEYLHEKIKSIPDSRAAPDCITFRKFCEVQFPGGTFSFYRWIYEIANFIKKHLCIPARKKSGPYQDGLITGFISREAATEVLTKNDFPGAFLLRFSDSVLGGIGIAWLNADRKVLFQNPFQKSDLQKLQLAGRILTFKEVTHLFPGNWPKEEKFKLEPEPVQTTDQPRTKSPGYVQGLLVYISKLSVLDKTTEAAAVQANAQATDAHEAGTSTNCFQPTLRAETELPRQPQFVEQPQQPGPSIGFQQNQVPPNNSPIAPPMQPGNYFVQKAEQYPSGTSSESPASTLPLEENSTESLGFDTGYNLDELLQSLVGGDCNEMEMDLMNESSSEVFEANF